MSEARFYVLTASAQRTPRPGSTDIQVLSAWGTFASKDEALGRWTAIVREKWPDHSITTISAEDATLDVLAFANKVA